MFGSPPESKLFPSEKRLVRIRTHWATLSKVTFQAVVSVVVLVLLTQGVSSFGEGPVVNGINTVLWYLEVLAVLYLLYHILEWWDDRIFVTDQRFFRVHGIIKIHTASMPRGKVTDFAYTRSLMGRMLGYGTLRLESAGQKQDLEYINYIPHSDEVVRAMFEQPQK
jgi:uncharacterized membrane protein YdbT with pleckstrin-like domain